MSTLLIWAGAAVCAFAAVRLLLTRDRYLRLHFVSLASVLATPLVIAGLALASWSSWHDVAKLVIIGALLFVTGPATVITAGRATMRASDG
ncbi:monovalent cation/H(+) antiporter subunit G [Actinomadura sp. DC4]|uniref:monovalent cation/H(+) antiporter subunit G n=1 Tax=Actinomadura sp. DC4 TaxID=3055069 RepID=UPI0025B22653|nr:monovalent cation/H(+) antiporter subunit G [Actinomadura sp. DC4]MDN3357963.1 monovalent cation/H(+) antiporter subunit G [Actinomadura sp. DC4]